ncbi:hypothetical protein [Terrimonas pollutisoli]|uniref:hypothetical protein n=1 Tax=Terrimonas pollutisoli TaxID=3034147 RepID=UPI0023EDFC3D|nr:hypothetical protein [Terrimonas sp. H1YJ31]
MAFTYRMSTIEDIDQLVEFWNINSGWDTIDRNEWERRFRYTPLGEPAISLAIDEQTNKLAGQFIFIPSKVVVSGKYYKAFRPFAPVLNKELQKFNFLNLLQHPIFQLYNQAVSFFREEGIALIHMVPDPRWSRAFQFVPFFQTQSFPLWSKPLAENVTTDLPQEISIQKIEPSDARIDALWTQASQVYSCQLVRSTDILPWKISHGDYHLTGVFYDSELTGLFTTLRKAKERQWLICDIVTKDGRDGLRNSLQAACFSINKEHSALPFHEQQNNKIALLSTPLIEPVIKEMGFRKDNYQFTLVVHLLSEQLSKHDVNPRDWYVSAND